MRHSFEFEPLFAGTIIWKEAATHINANPRKRKKKGRRETKRGEWIRPSQILMLKVIGGPGRNVDLAANTLSKENTKMKRSF